MAKMVAWFNDHGYQTDIPALRKRYPDLLDLESWLQVSGWGR